MIDKEPNKMNIKNIITVCITFSLISCASVNDNTLEDKTVDQASYSFDGLALTKEDSFDSVYINADVDFNTYDKVMLMPGDVSFKKNWERSHKFDVTEKDISAIKTRLSKLVYEGFKASLADQSRLEVTSTAGAGTLLIKPSIIKLDVLAPDIHTSARTRVYTRSAGEATLYLEVYDSVSGEILARIIDNQEDRDDGFLDWANRVTNIAEAKRIIKKWSARFNELLSKTNNK